MASNERMIVRIRFGRGTSVAGQRRPQSPMAIFAASMMTLFAIACAALGLWRVGTDMDQAGAFVFSSGLLSHWQVWIGAAVAAQYGSWRLASYGRGTPESATPAIEPVEDEPIRVQG